ncbi:TolC family protein [Carboxylicivirga sediminis]|uniref:TolC family protein n=1 Tax=Carboxylicivirga sediminis TaxID=2006564 RepID=A0A941F389_9BACT|nr:TolC family protein [Carboxylicivirga sediminis]MBR8535509.1 TolC family protein [Carboxylicivirga sediminis]
MKHYIFIIALFISIKGVAQQQVSLQESRQMALDYNKSLKAAKLKHFEAESQRKEARTAYMPNIDGTATATYLPSMDDINIPGFQLPVMDAAGNQTGQNVGFPGMSIGTEKMQYYNGQVAMQLPLYLGGQIRYANQMADMGVVISEQAYQLKTDEVIFNTDNTYWSLVAFKEQLTVAYKYYEMLDSLEQQMKDMYELGLTPKSEQLIVTVQKNEAQLNLMKAENAFKVMKMNLCQIVGLDMNTNIDVTDSLNLNPELITMSNSVDLAFVNRNELKMLDGQVTLSELQKKSDMSAYKPQLGAQVSYGYMDIPNLVDGQTMTQASAQLSIPLVHWREKKHKKDAAKLRIEQARLQLDETKDFVQLEVQQYIIRVNEAYEAIMLAKKNKEESEESLEEVTASFEAGLNTTTDVLNSQAAWLSANAELLNALASYEVAKTAYYKGIGQLYTEADTNSN